MVYIMTARNFSRGEVNVRFSLQSHYGTVNNNPPPQALESALAPPNSLSMSSAQENKPGYCRSHSLVPEIELSGHGRASGAGGGPLNQGRLGQSRNLAGSCPKEGAISSAGQLSEGQPACILAADALPFQSALYGLFSARASPVEPGGQVWADLTH